MPGVTEEVKSRVRPETQPATRVVAGEAVGLRQGWSTGELEVLGEQRWRVTYKGLRSPRRGCRG